MQKNVQILHIKVKTKRQRQPFHLQLKEVKGSVQTVTEQERSAIGFL